ncbi:hypothetical protein BC826DRAFT_1107400 [Russula brevipes]|nr:hypothetical protein BC826DRAFT_1107400 [Russula brevipes]
MTLRTVITDTGTWSTATRSEGGVLERPVLYLKNSGPCVAANKAAGSFQVTAVQDSTFYHTPAARSLSVCSRSPSLREVDNMTFLGKANAPASPRGVAVPVRVTPPARVRALTSSTVASSATGPSRFQFDFSGLALPSAPAPPACPSPPLPKSKNGANAPASSPFPSQPPFLRYDPHAPPVHRRPSLASPEASPPSVPTRPFQQLSHCLSATHIVSAHSPSRLFIVSLFPVISSPLWPSCSPLSAHDLPYTVLYLELAECFPGVATTLCIPKPERTAIAAVAQLVQSTASPSMALPPPVVVATHSATPQSQPPQRAVVTTQSAVVPQLVPPPVAAPLSTVFPQSVVVVVQSAAATTLGAPQCAVVTQSAVALQLIIAYPAAAMPPGAASQPIAQSAVAPQPVAQSAIAPQPIRPQSSPICKAQNIASASESDPYHRREATAKLHAHFVSHLFAHSDAFPPLHHNTLSPVTVTPQPPRLEPPPEPPPEPVTPAPPLPFSRPYPPPPSLESASSWLKDVPPEPPPPRPDVCTTARTDATSSPDAVHAVLPPASPTPTARKPPTSPTRLPPTPDFKTSAPTKTRPLATPSLTPLNARNKANHTNRKTVASSTVQDSVNRNTLKSNATPAARPPPRLATNIAHKNKTA